MKLPVTILSLILCCSAAAQELGMPFGEVDELDVVRLATFARKSGVDLQSISDGLARSDKEALARLFNLSLAFDSLDKNARTYGQIVYSSLLNVGEQIGVEEYAKILEQQPAPVRQRVRDFLFYPAVSRAPKEKANEVLAEADKMYPTLFPADFEFGRDDPIFAP
jgi:hypothetical protein